VRIVAKYKNLALRLAAAALTALGSGAGAQAQSGGLPAIGVPTFGGVWVWSDAVIRNDWRIQQHALTGHYRLIDPQDKRFAAGDFETCLARLDAIEADRKLPPGPKSVVIVVHGLGANRMIMSGLCDYLRDKGGLAVINFGYPSTMLEIGAYATSLDGVVRHLEGVEQVSFVAHSMGSIVVRKYLKDLEGVAPGMRPPVTFQRMVMISPPNHGAELADTLASGDMTREISDLFVGESANQLAPKRGWPALEPQLATPGFEFGIIAGGKGNDAGYLSAISGDDDGMLSVETMKLAGAADFVRVESLHQLMPRNDEVRAATLSFLKNGYFVAENDRHPIAAATAVPTTTPAATR
jgi:pimeloyl-ACP methyl ester carboxylesterase